MSAAEPISSRIAGLQTRAFFVGVAGLVVCLIGAFFNTKQFFISYLFAYLFWLGLALGCLGFLMIHHLSGGRWGFPVRRFFEAAIMTIPMMALLFIPICFGLHYIYIWTDKTAVAADPVLLHRSQYMSIPAFLIRTVVFFVIWSISAVILNKWSLEQDATTDVEPTRKLRTFSGPGIVFYPLTATFVYIDWVLSLEPDWFSTIFVVLIVIGQMLSGLAFVIVLLAWLGGSKPFSEILTDTHFHHLGMLLFAFIMLWTYMAFSQLLVIYSGNLPHEIIWFTHRIAGNWKVIVWFLVLFHFSIPFFLLLSADLKKNARFLATMAAIIFFAHLIDCYWLIAPSFFHDGIRLSYLDVAAPIGLGGIWIAAFARRLNAQPLLVRNDPRQHHEH